MEKIASFQKDHDKLMSGFYLSGTANGVSTFDLRFKKPNAGDYVPPAALLPDYHRLSQAERERAEKEKQQGETTNAI